MKYSIRSMLMAPKGKLFVAADLSQAESWIVAYSANEQTMIQSLNGSDIHTDTAGALFSPDNYCMHKWKKMDGDTRMCTLCNIKIEKTARYIGKRYNHASAYRMKPPRAMQVINKDSDKPPFVTVTLKESETYQTRWHSRYSAVRLMWWKAIEAQLSNNRTITTTYGRRRTFFSQWGDELFKEATAFIPQSTVADHFNGAIHPLLGISGGLVEIRKKFILPHLNENKIVHQGHDSCILEVPKENARDIGLEMQALIKRPCIINNQEFTIPTDGEIGERWGEMEALK